MVKDLDSVENIRQFIDAFYAELLADPQLAPIFTDVAKIDLSTHKDHIVSYWQKLLLGDSSYKRHTMDMHRAIDQQRHFTPADFALWLGYFKNNVQLNFAGPKAERALQIAERIAANMQANL